MLFRNGHLVVGLASGGQPPEREPLVAWLMTSTTRIEDPYKRKFDREIEAGLRDDRDRSAGCKVSADRFGQRIRLNDCLRFLIRFVGYFFAF